MNPIPVSRNDKSIAIEMLIEPCRNVYPKLCTLLRNLPVPPTTLVILQTLRKTPIRSPTRHSSATVYGRKNDDACWAGLCLTIVQNRGRISRYNFSPQQIHIIGICSTSYALQRVKVCYLSTRRNFQVLRANLPNRTQIAFAELHPRQIDKPCRYS